MVGKVTGVIELEDRRRIDRDKDEKIILDAFNSLVQAIRYGPKPETAVDAQLTTTVLAKTEKIVALARDDTKYVMRQYRQILDWLLWKLPNKIELQLKVATKYFDWWLIGYAEVCNIYEMVRIMFEISELGMNPILTEAVQRLLRNPAIEALFNDQRAKLHKLGKFAEKRQQLPQHQESTPIEVGIGHD